jgi:hypothetical protein
MLTTHFHLVRLRMSGGISPIIHIASCHASGYFIFTLLHPRFMGSMMVRETHQRLCKICHNAVRGPAVVKSNCRTLAERTVSIVCGILHRILFEMTADKIPCTEGDLKWTRFILLLFHNILLVKYVFKSVSERLVLKWSPIAAEVIMIVSSLYSD